LQEIFNQNKKKMDFGCMINVLIESKKNLQLNKMSFYILI